MARFTIFHSLAPEMGAELDKFVQVMVEKLEKNKHKDALEPPDLPKLMRLALTEMGEVVEQLLRDEADPNMIRECADAANFMFLIARHIHNKLQQRALQDSVLVKDTGWKT
jgi:hypothetical protein